ncbi:MAG: VCBS repeat-containing protein [Myxococcales bacterium]|nr:VCBS repeat-containing protein [Myxococcales bacterium]
MARPRLTLALAPTTVALALFACNDADTNPFDAQSGTSTTGAETTSGGSAPATTAPADTSTSVADTGEPPVLDVGNWDLPPGKHGCSTETPADIDPDSVMPCSNQAPPDSFDAEVQWTWGSGESYHTPLVINLTDDNGNGEIDVCDTPDVIVLVGTAAGTMVVLDGATGNEHFTINAALNPNVTPAVGDIDDDGLPELVAAVGIFGGTLVAYEHDGTPKWTASAPFAAQVGSAIGIANFDNEGSAEVYVAGQVVRGDTGELILGAPPQAGLLSGQLTAPVAADLDGDDDLEFIRGQDAYHLDGTVYYANPDQAGGFPQIGNLDEDDDPEILIISTNGISVFEHDGAVKYADIRPSGDPAGFSWYRPATIHDLDGDGDAEYAVSSASHYAAYLADGTVMWIANVQDPSGIAAGTAFDFLGDGTAEAIFADEYHLFAFDTAGAPLLQVDRSSGTLIEYPSVADVDNDGAADILVVSNRNFEGEQLTPTLQVIRDSQDRWIQARRIWNQHTYHVTNVNEDGTIPDVEPKSWRLQNTYRTNAQIEGGSVCVPPAG